MSINPFRSALQTLADLAETDGDYEKWLPILVDGSLEALPQFDHASITIRRSGDPLETIAATSEWARQGDRLQRALCEGPCYDAALEEGFRFSPMVRNDPNWPRYGPKVADLGIVSHLALHLNMVHGPRASLNLYAEQMVDADPDMLEIADLFAASMSNLLGLIRTVDQLQTGLGTNRTIGQAIGIMVERFHIPPERAHAYLVRLSQDHNTKLAIVAQQIVEDAASGKSATDRRGSLSAGVAGRHLISGAEPPDGGFDSGVDIVQNPATPQPLIARNFFDGGV
jgi:hypothetical protein